MFVPPKTPHPKPIQEGGKQSQEQVLAGRGWGPRPGWLLGLWHRGEGVGKEGRGGDAGKAGEGRKSAGHLIWNCRQCRRDTGIPKEHILTEAF